MSFKFTVIKEWQKEFKKRYNAIIVKLFPCAKKTTKTRKKRTTVKRKVK